MEFANQIKVTAHLLNCRLQPSMSAKILSTIKANEIYNIVAEQNGWGQLENGTWINLKFTIPVEKQEKVEESFVTEKATLRTHKVKERESLWDIAEVYLDDGARYVEIKKLNNLKSDILKTDMILQIPNK